jgi:hypothetical protein
MLQGNLKAPTAQWRTARDVTWLAVAVEDAFLPAAVLVGVEGKDWEDIVLQTSPTFWKLIEERRKQPTISLKELRKRLKKTREITILLFFSVFDLSGIIETRLRLWAIQDTGLLYSLRTFPAPCFQTSSATKVKN